MLNDIRTSKTVACGPGKYEGERCLIKGKYPVTKDGKPDPGRIRNVNVRATQFNKPGVIKKNLPYVRKHGIESKFDKSKK